LPSTYCRYEKSEIRVEIPMVGLYIGPNFREIA